MRHPFPLLLCFASIAVVMGTSAVASASEPSFADEASPAPTAPPVRDAPSTESTDDVEKESYWYGYQTLIVDGASLGTMLLGAASPTLGYMGLGGYVLGGPTVHVAHKNYAAALGSLIMRPLLPVVGGYLGYASAGTCVEKENSGFFGNCFLHGVGETALGIAIGASIAITVDAAVLARGERPVEKAKYDGKPKITELAPTYDARTGTTGLGLGGTF